MQYSFSSDSDAKTRNLLRKEKALPMQYYIGVDGGGTKTRLLLCDSEGNILAETQLGGCAHPEISVAGVRDVLSNGIRTLFETAKTEKTQVGSAAWGIPCFGEYPQQDEEITQAIRSLLPDAVHYVCNDVEVGLAGSLALQPGIHLVAGTGSVAMGRSPDGRIARSGGWHEDFSDEGSAYWLGLQALALFAKQADGRLPRGALYSLMRRELGLSTDMELPAHYMRHLQGNRARIARLQIALEQAALQGDASARALYTRAAQELFSLVEGVVHQLDASWNSLRVSFYGGVFKAGSLIMTPLRRLLQAQGAELLPPILSPAAGAILLAAQNVQAENLTALVNCLKNQEQQENPICMS